MVVVGVPVPNPYENGSQTCQETIQNEKGPHWAQVRFNEGLGEANEVAGNKLVGDKHIRVPNHGNQDEMKRAGDLVIVFSVNSKIGKREAV